MDKVHETSRRELNYVVLVHNGKMMDDGKQLRDYHIQDGATLLDIEVRGSSLAASLDLSLFPNPSSFLSGGLL